MITLIEGGTIIDPASGYEGPGDLVIEDDRVSAIVGPGDGPKDAEVVDARGLIVCPGLVDMHTHLREPGYEYKETISSGTRAAAAGGVTSVACMANTSPTNDSASVTEFIVRRAREEGVVRVYPIGAVTKGLAGEVLAEIGSMKEAGAVALSDDGKVVSDSGLMRRGMERARALGLVVITHSEDVGLVGDGVMNEGVVSAELGLLGSPSAAEEIGIFRDVALAGLTRARLHVAHVTTARGVAVIREAKRRGIPVTAETCPHYFTLTEDRVRTRDTSTRVNPPLRTSADVQAVIEGMCDGTIDVIASDHAPHAAREKEVDYVHAMSGMIGLETLLALSLGLVHEKRLAMRELIGKLSVVPAGVIGIDAGRLAPGMPADVTAFDPDEEWVYDVSRSFSKSGNSPFSGWEMKGRVRFTMVGGRIVYREGKIV